MAEKMRRRNPEQMWRWARNVSALGAVGLAAVGIAFPAIQGAMFAGATINGLQTIAADRMMHRQSSKKSAPVH